LSAVTFCIIAVFVFFPADGDTSVEHEKEYPVLEPNEKLPDVSFGWHPYPEYMKLVFEFDGPFPKMPDKMLVYRIIRPKNVTEAYVRELAQKYFDMPTDAVFRRDEPYCNLDTNAYNFMFQAHNGFFSILKHRKARKKLSEDRKDYPSDEECRKIATEYLKKRGLLPEDAYLYGVFDVNIESVGAMQVSFGRKIGQYDIWGNGSDILVEIGVAGEITKVSKRWVEYEPYKLAPIKTAKEAFEYLKHGNAFLATSSGKVKKIALAYHTPPEGDYIQPVYSFGFDIPEAYSLVPAIKPEYLKSKE